jgi:hypothetical protein
MMKSLLLSLFSLTCCIIGAAQPKVAELQAPAGFSDNNDAAGYYNKYNHRLVFCQQKDDTLYRLMCDSGFRILGQYRVANNEIAYRYKKKQKKRIFLTDLAAADYQYEIYQQEKQLFVYRLNFEAAADQLTATLTTNSTYADESVLAIMPSGQQLRYLTHSKKQNTLLLYTCNPADGSTAKVAFEMPKTNLSEDEVKRYNSEVKLKLANDMLDFAVERMDEPNVLGTPLDNRIFFDERQAYLLVKMPYNIGYYVIQILFNEGTMTQKNLFINSLQEDYYCGDIDKKKVLTATIADAVLIVGNNNAENLQFHFFNATTLAPLQSYNVNIADSLQTVVHSKLKQKGTWGSEKEIKELDNEKLYFRRKHTGSQSLSVAAYNSETLVLTSGSLIETGSPVKTLLTLASIGLGAFGMVTINTGARMLSDYLTVIRNGLKAKFKHLYTHAKFSRADFRPAGQANVTSFLDVIHEQLTDQRFNKPSSFFIQQGGTYYVGVFNKQSGFLELLKYTD